MSSSAAWSPAESLAPRGALDALVAEATRRAERLRRPVVVSLTSRVRPRDPLSAFAAAAEADRALWLRPEAGESLVGLGAAHVLRASGPDRFARLADAWRNLLGDALIEDQAGLPSSGPLLLGGFAFDPLRPSSAAWAAFGDAHLVLPGSSLAQRDGAAWLTRNVLVGPRNPAADEHPERHTDPPKASHKTDGKRLQRHTEGRKASHQADGKRLQRHTHEPEASHEIDGKRLQRHTDPRTASHGTLPSADDWQALVGSVVAGIRDGSLGVDKVVLARAEQLILDRRVDEACLRRLVRDYPTCTVFAVARGAACFLGATPERLAQVHHGSVRTMALAGSIGRGATPAEDRALGDQLLASPKERAEHGVVVRAIRDGLAEVCTSVVGPAEPRLVRLPNVQHLLTPLRAELSPGRGLFDVAAALHPSPAVGGSPRDRALAVIREREGLDRGWYGGLVGWVNAAGEGELGVGIRSALLRGTEAWLYAGCGIVADSDPAAERAESEWKLRPMRSALAGD